MVSMMTTTRATAIEIGDFIEIPAWRVEGLVIDTRSPMFGSDDAQEVLLQESPNDNRPRWYRMEPGQFKVIA
jgi:hypothetical protein